MIGEAKANMLWPLFYWRKLNEAVEGHGGQCELCMFF